MSKSTAKDMAEEAPNEWLCGLLFALNFPGAAVKIRRAMTTHDRRELTAKAAVLREGME